MKQIAYLFLLLTLSFLFCNKTLAQITDHAPVFIGGDSQVLTVCENTSANSIDTLLAIIDSDAGDTETWSVIAGPPRGTLAAAYIGISTGDTLMPSGLTYTPFAGYSGIDSFTISVSDGILADTTTIYVTVNPLPYAGVITGTPGACVGDTTVLSDTASGGVWSTSNTSIATINTSSGTVTGVSGGACTIIYTVINSCGTASNSLPFTVNATFPAVPSGIAGYHEVCLGSVITVRDATSGGKWLSSDQTIASVDSNLGIVTGISTGIAAITYAEVNFCASYYSEITLSVDPLPASITGSANLCIGAATDFYDSLAGGTWSVNPAVIATINPYTGVATGVGSGTALLTYSAGLAGCKITETVTVNATPTLFTVIGGGAYCAGGLGVSIGLSGSTAGISYQLYRAGALAGAPIPGTGSPLDFGLQTIAGVYTIVATNPVTGCGKNMTGSAAVSINPLPLAYTVTGGGGYCSGGVGYHIYLTASQSGISYELYNGATAIGLSVPGTGSALDFGLQTAPGTYTVTGTSTATSCARTMPGSATITINASPVIFAVIGGGNTCVGSPGVHIGLDSSSAGIDYQLYNGSATYSSAFPGTGIPLDFGLIPDAGLYTVVATNVTTGCTSVMAGSASVVINPLPASYPVGGSGHYCVRGAGLNIYLSRSDIGIVYQLYIGATTTGIALSGTDSVLDFGLHTAAGIYTVVATNTTTGCFTIMPGSATIVVDSLPSQYSITGGGGYCVGDFGVYIGLSGSDSGTDYQLYNDTTRSGIPESGSGGPLDLGLETIAGSYTIIATDPFTGCTSTMTGSAGVTVNPLPAAITGIDSVYTGATITLGDATPGGSWSSENTSIATTGPGGIIYADSAGYDTIAYTLPTGCAAKVEITVNYAPIDTTISIVNRNMGHMGGIEAFPNPTSGTVNIKWENQLTGNATLIITDVAGREVYKSAMNINAPSGQAQLQLDLSDGVYLLTIKSESVHYTLKVLVER